MANLFIGIIIGIIISSIFFNVLCWGLKNHKYKRACKNCKYSTPSEGRDKELHFYCGLAMQKDVTTFPVSEYNCCGHFDYTDELKTEQVKDNAEKMVKKR